MPPDDSSQQIAVQLQECLVQLQQLQIGLMELREDLGETREEISGLIQLWNTGSGLFKIIKWLSVVSAAITAIVVSAREILK